MSSPTQRSLKKLREEFPFVAVVEKWNPHARVRQDLFGFADIIAMDGKYTVLVQTTSASNMAARRKKILENHAAFLWVNEDRCRKILLHGWKKNKSKRWELKEEEVNPHATEV